MPPSGDDLAAARAAVEASNLDDAAKATILGALGASDKASSSPEKAGRGDGGQGRRAIQSDGPLMDDGSPVHIGGTSFLERTKSPAWIKARQDVYDSIKARRDVELEAKTPVDITITMPDGTVLDADKKTGAKFQSWRTSPYDVAASISQGLADSSVVARVTYADYCQDYDAAEDGVGGGDILMGEEGDEAGDDGGEAGRAKPILWDLKRALVGNVSRLELLKFTDDDEAKTVFWHSSAHMLGEALEHLYGSRLTIGPPLAGGFYYDSYMGEAGSDGALKEEDYKPVEQEVSKIIKSKQKFERLVVTKEEALELFEGNPFKEQIIKTKVPEGSRTSVYRCGDLIDLCRGPHVVHTGKVKAFAATSHSATNWLGDTDNDSLQRMYGVSFPDKKMLKVWKENQEKVSF